MKTELALLMLTDGRPSMTLEELARLRNIDPRTAMNQIHARRFPIPVWKDGAGYFAHVGDVAKWLTASASRQLISPSMPESTAFAAGSFSCRRGPDRSAPGFIAMPTIGQSGWHAVGRLTTPSGRREHP